MNEPRDSKSRETPTDFSQVGQRVVGWANNLIASALVILIGLTIGWGTLQVWRQGDDDDSTSESVTRDLTRSASDFKEPAERSDERDLTWRQVTLAGQRFDRREFRGDRRQAIELLQQRCEALARTELHRPKSPASSPFGPKSGRQPDSSASLQSRDIQAKGIGSAAVHSIRLPGLMPMVITLKGHEESQGESRKESREETETLSGSDRPSVSTDSQDVLSWGLAMSTSTHTDVSLFNASVEDSNQADASNLTWTLFAFHQFPQSSAAEELPWGLRLPPGSQLSLSLNDPSNHRVVGFTTAGSLSECELHFQQALRKEPMPGRLLVGWNRQGHHSACSWAGRHGDVLRIQLDEHRGPSGSRYVVGVMVWEQRALTTE